MGGCESLQSGVDARNGGLMIGIDSGETTPLDLDMGALHCLGGRP